MAEWLESGAEAVRVVDPRSRTAVVHEPDGEHRAFSVSDTLHGSPVLPGFELPLTRLFSRASRARPPSGRNGSLRDFDGFS